MNMEGNIYKKTEEDAKRLTDMLEADTKKSEPSLKPEWVAKLMGRVEKGTKEKLDMLKNASNDEDTEEIEKRAKQ